MKYPISAKRLKQAMEAKGMKAVELSARAGVLRSSLSQYMNGSHNMSNKAAGAISEVLGVDPLWLMGFDVPMIKEDVEKSQQEQYYIDPETARVAQAIFDDSALHALFDAAQNSRPEDLQMAADLLKRLKGTNPDG